MTLKEDLLSSLSFFSIMPMKKEHYSQKGIYFMFIPYMLAGLISSLISYLILPFLPVYIIGIIALFLIILFHGAQNADGLMDFGDGVMKRGTWEDRLKAMKDTTTGTGAIIAVLFVYLMTVGGLVLDIRLYGIWSIFYAQLMGITFIAILFFRSDTLGDGFASFFKKYVDNFIFLIMNIIFPIFIAILFFSQFLIVTVICCLLAIVMRMYVKKTFTGVNGDILGASGEIGRMLSIILIMVPALIINLPL